MKKDRSLLQLIKESCHSFYPIDASGNTKIKRIVDSDHCIKKAYRPAFLRFNQIALHFVESLEIENYITETERISFEQLKQYQPSARQDDMIGNLYILRAGDLENQRGAKSMTKFTKAINNVLRLLILALGENENKTRNIIHDSLAIVLGYIFPKFDEEHISSICNAILTHSMISSSDFDMVCSVLFPGNKIRFDNETDSVTYYLLGQEFNCSSHEIYESLHHAPQFYIENDQQDILESRYNELKNSKKVSDLVNAFSLIIYTYLVGICVCGIRNVPEHIVTEYYDFLKSIIPDHTETIPVSSSLQLLSLPQAGKARKCTIVINSPVNVTVYLKDKLVAEIDNNHEFTKNYFTTDRTDQLKLRFVAKGFSKTMLFHLDSNEDIFTIDLHSWLSGREIILSYDRQDAIDHLQKGVYYYCFQQLCSTGIRDDIPLVRSALTKMINTHTQSVLISKALYCLCHLSVKYDDFSSDDLIRSVMKAYEKKELFYPIASEAVRTYRIHFDRMHIKKPCQITVLSPVNVKVYLEDMFENSLLFAIDHNHAPYQFSKEAMISERGNKLIFLYDDNHTQTMLFGFPENGQLFIDLSETLTYKELTNLLKSHKPGVHSNMTAFEIKELYFSGQKSDLQLIEQKIRAGLYMYSMNTLTLFEAYCRIIMNHARDIDRQQLADYSNNIRKMKNDLVIAYTSQKSIIQEISEECMSYIDQFLDAAA
ncbi:MAG: hypothetical protein Q4D24_11445 [Erysipelotrichaceae bacterium]|nr:hypothetical protein [Erysipelotrichaceae bacterium]